MDIKAKTGDEKGAIERSLNEVQNEHLLLGTTMDEKKQVCNFVFFMSVFRPEAFRILIGHFCMLGVLEATAF